MIDVNCHYCHSDDFRVLFRGTNQERALRPEHVAARQGDINKTYRHRWVRCTRCGLVYATPVPSQELLERLYAASDQADYRQETGHLQQTYGRYLQCYLPLLQRRSAAMDIGAGSGFFLETLGQMGFSRVVGIEPSVPAWRAAPPALRPVLKNRVFDPDDFAPGSFDCVTCFQTLEHVPHPGRLFEGVSRLLAPGGLFFGVAHDFGAPAVRLLGARHPIVNAAHLTLFDRATLRRFVARHLEVVALFSVRNRYSLRYWLTLVPAAASARRRVIAAAERMRIADRVLALNPGNIGIVARKERR